MHAALSMEEQIAGVVALSMWHLPSITGSEAAEASKRGGRLPVLFCHGAKDKVITSQFAEHMCGEMASALDANYEQFDDLAHGICADELSAVRQFLNDRIPGQTKYDSVNQLPATYRRQNGGLAKSNAKVWGDGSEVSARRSDAEFQASLWAHLALRDLVFCFWLFVRVLTTIHRRCRLWRQKTRRPLNPWWKTLCAITWRILLPTLWILVANCGSIFGNQSMTSPGNNGNKRTSSFICHLHSYAEWKE